MMVNFRYDIPTQVYFGKGQIAKLAACVTRLGSSVLLCYGGGSIKKTGLYDTVVHALSEAGVRVVELSGIEPNPRVTSVNEGVRLIRAHQLEVVLAVGGGSVIDCAKVIAASADYDGDAWEIVRDGKKIKNVLPIVSVLTLSATGSEMDSGAVISNPATGEKWAVGNRGMFPRYSILDPTYTYTVSKYQTAAGTADIMSHIFEVYFSRVSGSYTQDRMSEALLKTCIEYGPVAMAEPENYDARANLMWTSSLAINGLLSFGKGGAWSAHAMEHPLSGIYDITHGAGLAILTPHWMRYILNEDTVGRFVEYGINVWGIDGTMDKYEIAHIAIDKTEEFFTQKLELPATLSELGIDSTRFEEMAEQAVSADLENAYVPLGVGDVMNIYMNAL